MMTSIFPANATDDRRKHNMKNYVMLLVSALALAGLFSGCSTTGHYPCLEWEAGTSYTPPLTVEAHGGVSLHPPQWIQRRLGATAMPVEAENAKSD